MVVVEERGEGRIERLYQHHYTHTTITTPLQPPLLSSSSSLEGEEGERRHDDHKRAKDEIEGYQEDGGEAALLSYRRLMDTLEGCG